MEKEFIRMVWSTFGELVSKIGLCKYIIRVHEAGVTSFVYWDAVIMQMITRNGCILSKGGVFFFIIHFHLQ